MSSTLTLAKALIERPSVTPDDAGCLPLIQQHLEPLGFTPEFLNFADTDNLWSRRGTAGPLFVFAGHTDVVPPGPEEAWNTPPFSAIEHEGMLYGRGAADMKSSLAAMVTACQRFVDNNPHHKGSIAFLLTSDEEGPAKDGTVRVVETLTNRDESIDYCLVGEPSSQNRLGDIIRNGRRGSINGRLTLRGIQGHGANPEQVVNPIHLAAPILQALVKEEWDRGNEYFPPTSFQIANLNAGTGAENVVPGTLTLQFNLRFSSELTEHEIKTRVHAILDRHDVDYNIEWRLSGNPFITPAGTLTRAAQSAVDKILGTASELSTGGGTSDGRFIAPTGAQVIELGPLNATIHQVNECVNIEDIDKLSMLYEELLNQILL